MSSRELVIELVNKLPVDAPLADIAREFELLAGIQAATDSDAICQQPFVLIKQVVRCLFCAIQS